MVKKGYEGHNKIREYAIIEYSISSFAKRKKLKDLIANKGKFNIKRGDQIGLSYFGHLEEELLREREEKRERKRRRRRKGKIKVWIFRVLHGFFVFLYGLLKVWMDFWLVPNLGFC